jgi:L-lysine exporter family protein LysE/ArgO
MLTALFTGFFLGFSLILAIGAQNAFVLRQGIIGKHVFYVALFCAISDALLITIGIIGISFFLNNFINQVSNLLFGFSAIWLFGYGILRLKAAFKANTIIEIESSSSNSLLKTLMMVAIFTYANPHVYLDTMILIGTVSQQFIAEKKIVFAIGASLASFIFFFTLAYGAKLLAPFMKKPSSWRVLDSLVAIVMFTISIKLLFAGNWL